MLGMILGIVGPLVAAAFIALWIHVQVQERDAAHRHEAIKRWKSRGE